MAAALGARRTVQRLAPDVREQQIVAEAIRYFSRHGFSASTVELARRLGVTQPLVFRYFPTKDALIQRIYEEIETELFKPRWLELIEDVSQPLKDRLTLFYVDYFHSVMTEDRFRLFLHEGLSSHRGHGGRYYDFLRRTVLASLVRALRQEFGRGSEAPPSAREVEVALSLHGMIHHMAIRRWVYGPDLSDDVPALVELKVGLFLGGARAVLGAADGL